MEADGSGSRQSIACGRQHVLTAVLLHVIEAPDPVDRPMDGLADVKRRLARLMLVEHVNHRTVVLVEDIDNGMRGLGHVERANVERLPARGRVERRAIQRDERTPVAVIDAADGGVKLAAVRVRVVQPLCHWWS